jgi:hypothetical protein
MQTRFYNYGQTYNSAQHNDARFGVTAPGPYRGFGLSADATNNIVIAAGYGALHDGYVWKEDGDNLVDFSAYILPGAADYTICAVHVDRQILGGATVTYEVRAGIAFTILDGVVLGWVRYPGGAIPLATAHLQKAPNLLLSSYGPDIVTSVAETRYAPFNNAGGCYTTPGFSADITVTDLDFDGFFVVHQSLKNSDAAAGMNTIIQHLQFYAGSRPPSSFDFWVAIDTEPTTNLTAQVFDTALVPVAAAEVITGTAGAWASRTMTLNYNNVATATFDYGEPYTLRLTYNLGHTPGSGKVIKLAKVTASCWAF